MDKRATLISILIIIVLGGVGIMMFGSSDTANTSTSTLPKNTTAMTDIKATELKIEVLKEGSGPEAKKGDNILVDYTGTLTDGKIFDSSVGRAPFSLSLGAGQVIQGWDQGLVGMKVGEKRRLTIPSGLAYGKNGFPGAIPPDATLIFEVELKAIK